MSELFEGMDISAIPKLSNKDICDNPFKYDAKTIEWNIRNSCLSLRKLVRYQKLTPYICAKYVVFGGRNEMYADCTEDAWISTSEIISYQPHITIEEMHKAHRLADEEDELEDAIDKSKLLKSKVMIRVANRAIREQI
jgi:hypothetical protein